MHTLIRSRHRLVPGAILAAIIASSPFAFAANPVAPAGDTPSVEMAPVVDRPLQPSLAQEVPQAQPSPQHVWIAGHWRWQDGSFAWIPARWELPPAMGAAWVAPRWEQRSNGYVLIAGYWEQSAEAVGAPANVAQDRRDTDDRYSTAPYSTAPYNNDRNDDDGPRSAPPAARYEVVPRAPSASHVWISGSWEYRNGRYAWEPGRWSLPPRDRLTWVPSHWDFRANHYVYIPGYWHEEPDYRRSNPGPRDEVVLRIAPPPAPRREVVPPRPNSRYVWVGGYWRANGPTNTIWVSGRWTLPPSGGRYSWVAPRWERRGSGYAYIEGYWH